MEYHNTHVQIPDYMSPDWWRSGFTQTLEAMLSAEDDEYSPFNPELTMKFYRQVLNATSYVHPKDRRAFLDGMAFTVMSLLTHLGINEEWTEGESTPIHGIVAGWYQHFTRNVGIVGLAQADIEAGLG